MAQIDEKDINEIRNRADIVSVISRYIPVQKSGKSFRAVCPFHNDHDPSLNISPEKQIYKCFVCGEGGNVFTFVQNYEKISFVEAVKEVADIVGYHLTYDVTTKKEIDPHKQALYKVLDEMIRFTMYELNTDIAKQEREYLEKRGLNDSIREKFQIGFNPFNNSVYNFLKAKGYKDQDIVSTNIGKLTDSGIQDVFEGRITFPIHDTNGNPIGFSARTLVKDTNSKYINTNDTEIFHKGTIVYNYHRAKNEARRSAKIYLTEGVTDVIAFARAGIDNCVCTLGTACTREQLLLLKNTTVKLVFCYDGDEAGQRATYKAASLARSLGIEVSIIDNKTGKDPDEIIRDSGSEALKDLVKKEISWFEFLIHYLAKHTNFDNYDEKKSFVKKSLNEIQTLDDTFDRKNYISELEKLTGFDLQDEKVQVKTFEKVTHDRISVKTPNGLEEAEELILAFMLRYQNAIDYFESELGYLTNNEKSRIAMAIVDMSRRFGKIDTGQLIDICNDDIEKKIITKLMTSWMFEVDYDENVMKGAIRKVMIAQKNKQAKAFKEQLSQPMNDETRLLVLNKYQECLRDLRRYIDEENN